MTSCFVYKVMGLTFHEKINTQLIYRFELAYVVARRITKPQRKTFRFESHWLLFFLFSFFYFYFQGGGSDFIILFMSFFLSFYYSIYLKNMVYHVATFFVPIAMFGLRIKTLRLCHVDIYMSRQNQIEV